jgi:hypothetical protein
MSDCGCNSIVGELTLQMPCSSLDKRKLHAIYALAKKAGVKPCNLTAVTCDGPGKVKVTISECPSEAVANKVMKKIEKKIRGKK